MRRRTNGQAGCENDKVRSIRIRTDDICGGMLTGRERQDPRLTMLAGSIARYGLLQPVVVRRNPALGRYVLVCGMRRLAACRLLGVREINAMLIEADEETAVACFLQEHAAHCPPHFLAEAELIAGREDIAEKMPDCGMRLKRACRLLALPQPVKDVVRRHALSLEQAEPLLAIAQPDRQLEAANVIAERGLSPAQARRLACVPEGNSPEQNAALRGRRRMMRIAMEEVSRLAERLRVLGVETGMTVHAQERRICVQILIQNGKKAAARQEYEK